MANSKKGRNDTNAGKKCKQKKEESENDANDNDTKHVNTKSND